MSEAWHVEQIAADTIPGYLVTPHNPSPACGGTHCSAVITWMSRMTARTADASNAGTSTGQRKTCSAPGWPTPHRTCRPEKPPAEEIFFCPTCLHDW